MLFVSAQPDEYYFLWQLELQLYNLYKLGVPKEKIHVLIGYQPEKGIDIEYQNLSKKNRFAQFFFYPDDRRQKGYLSSIRPHLLKQHFKRYPKLSTLPIFYHDSDILFHSLPNFQKFNKGKDWFVSDTRKYISTTYIDMAGGKGLLKKMCQIVGISPDIVKDNDSNAGGAQYIIKDVDYLFWEKVEEDSERLYKLLSDHNQKEGEKYYKEKGKPISRYHGIQAWCADMWALLWNAWLNKYNVKIDKELDFCWPHDEYKSFEKKKILHYTGTIESNNKKLFGKTHYIHYPPYYDDDLNLIDKNTCSYIVVQKIDELLKAQKRYDLKDVSFLIPAKVDSEEKKRNILIIIKYLQKYFDTNIIILEINDKQKIDPKELPASVAYLHKKNQQKKYNKVKSCQELWCRCQTPIISLFSTDVVLPVDQMIAAVEAARQGHMLISPFSEPFFKVDQLFKEIFGRLLDPKVLELNRGKFNKETKQSQEKVFFMKKEMFLNMNSEEVYSSKKGNRELDMTKRFKNLSAKTRPISGPVFRLWHP